MRDSGHLRGQPGLSVPRRMPSVRIPEPLALITSHNLSPGERGEDGLGVGGVSAVFWEGSADGPWFGMKH